jgi:hypothetical protein
MDSQPTEPQHQSFKLTPPAKPQTISFKRLAIMIAAAIIGFFILIVISVATSNSSNTNTSTPTAASNSQKTTQQAKYSANVDVSSDMVVNPADLAGHGTVKNTGDAAGTPSCSLSAHDDTYTYTGIDVIKPTSPIQPGDTWNFEDDMTITKQGAQYVTAVDIKC